MKFPRILIISFLSLATILACASGGQAVSPTAASAIVEQPTQPDSAGVPTAASQEGGAAAPSSRPVTQSSPQTGPADLSTGQIALKPLVQGLDQPIAFVSPYDQTGRMFAVTRKGTILVVKGQQIEPVPFLDLSSKITTSFLEQGLLSLVFHPAYSQNGFFFVYYTDVRGNVVVSRFSVSSNPDVADPGSEQVVLQIDEPARNHNGGDLHFGPDGYLYVSIGDGGGAGDTYGNGQNPGALLAKILRIDVDNLPYSVPADNPFVGQPEFRPEIWSWGFRNPWRFSFDRQTGDMYIADVGQNTYEEIDFQPAGVSGQNYGWPIMEGTHCYNAASCSSDGLTLPVAEYSHGDGCSVSGGFVYRGSQFPALNGIYFYSDYCSGNIWGTTYSAEGSWPVRTLLTGTGSVSSFGQDEAGEVYVVDLAGQISQLVQAGN